MKISTMARWRRSQLRAAGTRRARKLGFEPLERRTLLSLTHLYTFNDGTASDSVGTAHGTLQNGASVVDGKLALQNTGMTSGQSSDVQHVQLPSGILPERDATIEVWYAAANSPNWSRVFDIGSQSGTSGDSYLFFTQQSGPGDSRAALRSSGAIERVVTSSTTDDGLQHMAAVVIDTSAGLLRLYLDGSEVDTESLGRGVDAGSVDDALGYLGRSLFDADPGFTGLIDELQIYDEAVPGTQIAAHAAEGPAVELLPGDYDGSRVVDAADYSLWKSNYGFSGDHAADGNGDGVVDLADYTIWRDNRGRGAETPASQTLSGQSMTVATLSDTTIELTDRSELHITGTGNPIRGSEIRLNSDDAWLFFENIKPSVVNSTYLSQVRINGEAAFHGINARVVQHELGTVVVPHAAAYEPLEAFTGPNFTGDSQSFGQYTYYNNTDALGEMHRNLSSFKLKRGYMATIATEANGSGLSKVYVAQDHDLHVSLLPEEYDNQVQFLRVFPWRWVSKKGASDIGPATLDAAWNYNWNNDQNSTLDWEYVPIRQQRWWPGYPTDKPDVTHLLGFNEPDNPVEDAYETLDNGSVDTAIAVWPELLATGLRVGSPAVTDGGKAWLYEFMDKAIASDLRVDYIAIHNYQCGHSASSLQNWLEDVYDRYELPIWLTEFNNGANWTGCGDPSQQQNAQVIGSFIDMMDNTPWIERYSIYSRVEAVRELTYSDGSLTPTGQVYHDNASPIGYVQQVAAPGNTEGRSIAQLPFDGQTLDTSGYGYNGHVAGVPSYVSGSRGEALDLDGTSNYVQLPEDVASGDEFSFAAWVNWDGGGNWQRIFDFGNDTSSNLFLTPSNGSVMRFAIKDGGGEQIVQTNPLPTGEWTHVAVTLGGGSAKLYVDGSLVATNNSVTITPSDFNPRRNYLGDSQWVADPLFNGRIDDVLITDTVLTQSQIAGLMTNTPPEFAAGTLELGPAIVGTAFNDTVAGLATDADSEESITYGKANGPDWLSVAPDGTLSGTPGADNLAPQEFVVTATDSKGATAYTVVTIPVREVAPRLTAGATATGTSTQPLLATSATTSSLVAEDTGEPTGATVVQDEQQSKAVDAGFDALLLATEPAVADDAVESESTWNEASFDDTEDDLFIESELADPNADGSLDAAFALL